MLVLENMYVFEAMAIVFAYLTGMSAALLPDPCKPERPIKAIMAFSVCFGGLATLLPIVVEGKDFLQILIVSLVAATIGWMLTWELTNRAAQQRLHQKSIAPKLSEGNDEIVEAAIPQHHMAA